MRNSWSRPKAEIDRLTLGNLGKHRVLDGGVYELKIDCEPGYRVYFGKIGNIVLLPRCGGDKRTHQQDIKTAKAYLKEYQDAQNHG